MTGQKKAQLEPSSSKHEATTSNTCRLFPLPYPIILNILLRVPIDDLFHCRCVCKRFLCFISDPEFLSLHLSRSPLCMLVKTYDEAQHSKRFHLTHLDAGGANFQVSKLNFTPNSNVPTCDISIINACNGLLFWVDTKYMTPPMSVTQFWVNLSLFNHLIRIGVEVVLRGLVIQLSLTNTKFCKAIIRVRQILSLVKIYTIGTGTWRSIGNVPNTFTADALPFNAFLNGSLHWSYTSSDGSEFIHTFDFDAEQFGTIPPPDHSHKTSRKYSKTFGVLGGCLFVICFTYTISFDIWVMKEYCKKESWTKQFDIENLYTNSLF